ncbi:MAG: hypothetical protein NZ528_10945 [Caldilineales bacterium]|nr:hypothetical protein [Caldilineales bacterium]MDW8316782.1 hypothetical protein [Anaerolineae bacterium]
MSATASTPSKAAWRSHLPYLLAVLLATAVMLFLWGQVDWTKPPADRWDGWHYRSMAAAAPGFSAEAAAPFRYRLLGTYTVGLLFSDIIVGFQVVNYAAFVTLALLFYLFLCRVGLSRGVAAYTTALFTMNTHLFGITAWLTFHTNDVLSLVLLLAALWAMLDRRWGWFGLFIALGALSRETWVLAPATAAVFLWERRLLRSDGAKLLLATLPAVLITVVLRTQLRADVPGSYEPLKAFLRFGPKFFELEFWARQFGNSLKPLTFLPLIFLGATARFFRAHRWTAALILLTFASSLLGSANERLMAPAFPAFYWLLGTIVQEEIWPNRPMLAIIAAAAFLSTPHYWYARYPLPSRELTIALGAASWAAVTIAALVFRLRGPGRTAQPLPRSSGATPP